MSDEENEENDYNMADENDNTMKKENEEFQEEIEKIEEERKKHEERKREEIKKLRKGRETGKMQEEEGEQKHKTMGGQSKMVNKKTYDRKSKIFRNNRLNDFSGSGAKKIEKVLRKVHGVSLKKKMEFLKAMKAYNPTKSILKRKDFDAFARRFKSRRFMGSKFKKIGEEEIDIKNLRSQFRKRDIDKIKRGVTGQSDPHKYKGKNLNSRSTPRPTANRTIHF